MGDDVYRNPQARARVDELLKLPKAQLVDLARAPAPNVRSHIPAAKLARWHKQELAWCIARVEFALDNGPRES